MWIMITSKIPVQEKYSPSPLDIYWGIPWNNNKEKLSTVLERMDEDVFDSIMREIFNDSKNRPYFYSSRIGTRLLYNQSVLEDQETSERIWDIIIAMKTFPGNGMFGHTPNKEGKLRIMVGEESVGIYPHEFSILTKENMEIYLEESHKLVMSDVSKEVFGIFDEDQKFIRDAAMLDGCDYHQANRVALGKNVEFDFPLPFGYYSCSEETRSHFF